MSTTVKDVWGEEDSVLDSKIKSRVSIGRPPEKRRSLQLSVEIKRPVHTHSAQFTLPVTREKMNNETLHDPFQDTASQVTLISAQPDSTVYWAISAQRLVDRWSYLLHID